MTERSPRPLVGDCTMPGMLTGQGAHRALGIALGRSAVRAHDRYLDLRSRARGHRKRHRARWARRAVRCHSAYAQAVDTSAQLGDYHLALVSGEDRGDELRRCTVYAQTVTVWVKLNVRNDPESQGARGRDAGPRRTGVTASCGQQQQQHGAAVASQLRTRWSGKVLETGGAIKTLLYDFGNVDHRASLVARRTFCHGASKPSYCSVTSIWITPAPFLSGSSALPTTAPSIRARSVPFIARPGAEEVTSRSPAAIGPFSAVTLQGTIPTTANGTSLRNAGSSMRCWLATTPGLVEKT